MRPRTYTEIMLTLIALCLLWICVRDVRVVDVAQATDGQPVVLVGIRQPGVGAWDPIRVSGK